MQDLKISIIQSELYWENPEANLAMFEEKIWQIDEDTDLIILPEMFSTGFSMDSERLAEPMNFKSFKWMKQMAAQTKVAITGSLIIKENGHYYNRLIWMTPDGEFKSYDKRHLFRMADEHNHYSQGSDRLIIDYKGWKICPQICYDLRFPVWSRNGWNRENNQLNFDLLIFVANWPAPRVSAWDTLLQARAIENLSFAVGVNRIGEDGLGVAYCGHSAVIDFKGNELFQAKDQSIIKTLALSSKDLTEFRHKFPAYMDADNFQIES